MYISYMMGINIFWPACKILVHIAYTVKPVLSSHSIIDKTKVLKAKSSLMKVENICRMLSLLKFLLELDWSRTLFMIPSLLGNPTSFPGFGAVAPSVALLHSEWENRQHSGLCSTRFYHSEWISVKELKHTSLVVWVKQYFVIFYLGWISQIFLCLNY